MLHLGGVLWCVLSRVPQPWHRAITGSGLCSGCQQYAELLPPVF